LLLFSLLANLVFWQQYRLERQQLLDARLVNAIKEESVPQAIALLRQGASANAADSEGMPPGWLDTLLIRLGLRKRAPEDLERTSPAIFLAVGQQLHMSKGREEHADLIRELIKHGANPNERDEFGATPIGYAAVDDHPNEVRAFIDGGADVNAKDKKGDTALSVLLSLRRQFPKTFKNRCIDVLKRAGAK
jgi:ankyrin repeat protein